MKKFLLNLLLLSGIVFGLIQWPFFIDTEIGNVRTIQSFSGMEGGIVTTIHGYTHTIWAYLFEALIPLWIILLISLNLHRRKVADDLIAFVILCGFIFSVLGVAYSSDNSRSNSGYILILQLGFGLLYLFLSVYYVLPSIMKELDEFLLSTKPA